MNLRQIVQYSLLFSLVLGLSACFKPEDVKIDLPPRVPTMVIESYLQPDSLFRVSVSTNIDYFAKPSDMVDTTVFPPRIKTVIDKAIVTIEYNGRVDTLKFYPFLSPDMHFKFGEYRSTSRVPADYNTTFNLRVVYPNSGWDPKKSDTVVTGQTRLMPPIAYRRTYFDWSPKTIDLPVPDRTARVAAEWDDPEPGKTNYYHMLLFKGSRDSIADFAFTDRLVGDTRSFISSGYDYLPGDSVEFNVYHLDEATYQYFRTVGRAMAANANPFSEPSVLLSNVKGGLGIFAGVGLARTHLTIPRE